MQAALYSLSVAPDVLRRVACDYSPRVEMAGRLVLADLQGLTRLFGGAEDIAAHLRGALAGVGAVRLAIAPTGTAAALFALGRPGVTVVAQRDALAARLAPVPVSVLGELERCRSLLPPAPDGPGGRASIGAGRAGWQHPRGTHEGQRLRRQVQARRPGGADHDLRRMLETLDVLRRWGIRTCGQLAALPPDEVAARLGARGTRWQREARGEETRPLVPYVDEETFEATLDLEWPIEGLEPLSFVLGRLLEPLSARLERRDRAAAVIHTDLTLVSGTRHQRTLQLPSPMREAKTLRTLILLDLESHLPGAAVDRVAIRVEPTPGRVLQWSLLERAQPAPEQVSTLVARLTALMGESHVGTPVPADSWRPGQFSMAPFTLPPPGEASTAPDAAAETARSALGTSATGTPPVGVAFRRFRLPVPARVLVREGRPLRITPDRRGIAGGSVVEAAGPWRTSGAWWAARPQSDQPVTGTSWNRDEWDVRLGDGTACRVFLERDVGQWYIEGLFD